MSKTRKARRTREAPPPAPLSPLPQARVNSLWNTHGWRIGVLWILVLIAYSNSFSAGLVFDNDPVLLRDPRIQAVTPDNLHLILTEGYWHTLLSSGLYRPLTTFSYLLNYTVLDNGAHPAGYHWVNFGLHALNVSLVYALGILAFSEPGFALALAGIWGLHPLLTESVTNVVGRADLLAACGVLAGLLCYVQGAAATGSSRWKWWTALAAAQTAGLFAKENAAVLPGILLAYDVAWSTWQGWRRRVPAYAALALPFALFFFLRSRLNTRMDILFMDNPLIRADFWTARLTALKVAGKLVWLFFWPDRLSVDYSYNGIPVFGWNPANWEDAKALIAVAFCLGLLLLAIYVRRTQRALFFFILFFLIALAPTSNLIVQIGSIMAERFVYLPSIGLAGAVFAVVHWSAPRLRLRHPARDGWVAAAVVCLLFAGRTYARNADWHDELRLWSATVKTSPNVARAHMNLGHVLSQNRRRLPEAIAEYQTALRIYPDYAQAHYDLGVALADTPRRLAEAIAEFRTAVRLKPDYADAHYNLGTALAQSPEHLAEALEEWQTTLRLAPENAGAHNNLGNALARMPDRLPDAIAEWEAATRSDPGLAAAHYNLGNAYLQMPDRLQDAVAEFQAALRANPRLAEAHNNLANALARIAGRMPEAVQEWKAAIHYQPNLAQAYFNLGQALSQMPGRVPEAIADYEAGLRLKPDPQIRQTVNQLRALSQSTNVLR